MPAPPADTDGERYRDPVADRSSTPWGLASFGP